MIKILCYNYSLLRLFIGLLRVLLFVCMNYIKQYSIEYETMALEAKKVTKYINKAF